MSLISDTTFVLDKLGLDKNNQTILLFAKNAARNIYKDLWRSGNYRATKQTLVINNAEKTIRLPHYVAAIIASSYDNRQMFRISEAEDVMTFAPEAFDTDKVVTGVDTYMSLSPDVGVYVAPGGGTITVQSSSESDDGVVSVHGTKDGEDVVEEITLSGMSQVSSIGSYDEIYTLSKPETTGTITVKDSSGNTIQTLLPHENSRNHKRIQLVNEPDDTTKKLIMLVKMHPVGYLYDNDSPMIDGSQSFIRKSLEAEMLEYDEQYDKANNAERKSGDRLSIILNEETNINETNVRATVEPNVFGYNYNTNFRRPF